MIAHGDIQKHQIIFFVHASHRTPVRGESRLKAGFLNHDFVSLGALLARKVPSFHMQLGIVKHNSLRIRCELSGPSVRCINSKSEFERLVSQDVNAITILCEDVVAIGTEPQRVKILHQGRVERQAALRRPRNPARKLSNTESVSSVQDRDDAVT